MSLIIIISSSHHHNFFTITITCYIHSSIHYIFITFFLFKAVGFILAAAEAMALQPSSPFLVRTLTPTLPPLQIGYPLHLRLHPPPSLPPCRPRSPPVEKRSSITAPERRRSICIDISFTTRSTASKNIIRSAPCRTFFSRIRIQTAFPEFRYCNLRRSLLVDPKAAEAAVAGPRQAVAPRRRRRTRTTIRRSNRRSTVPPTGLPCPHL